jgi:hypothetical protein
MKTELRIRKCCACRIPFHQQRPLQKACSPRCAELDAVRRRERRDAVQRRQQRVSDRAHAETLKSLRELIEEAQKSFNAFIRFRDRHQRCICCDQPFEPERPGGAVDAGHYLARSIAPQHRFNEDNVFAQRKNCNRPGGTTRAAFRAGVESRIGLQRLEALESDTTVHKWAKDEVRAIRDDYRAKLKQLKKEAA